MILRVLSFEVFGLIILGFGPRAKNLRAGCVVPGLRGLEALSRHSNFARVRKPQNSFHHLHPRRLHKTTIPIPNPRY